MLGLVALLQTVLIQPLPERPQPEAFPWKPDPAALSLVVARSGKQDDPQRLCAEPGCTALYRGTFDNAATIAGKPLPKNFTARIEMGSPFISRYTLALIVEHRADGTMLVRAQQGFHGQTHLACFEPAEVRKLDWHPQAARISGSGDKLCVAEH